MSAYEFDGHKYREAAGHTREWGQRVVEELGLQGHESLLDLGCGDGLVTRRIAERLPSGRVLGIDSSQGMLAAARRLAAESGWPVSRMEFQLQDILDFECREQFDVVFSNAALHWVSDHERVLANAFLALKNGGRLRANFGGQGNCQNFLAVVKELMQEEPFTVQLRDFRWPWYFPAVEEYEQLLESSPFSEFQVWLENTDRWFTSADEMVAWMEQPSLVPFISALEGIARQRFHDQAVERMLARTAGPDGRYFETFRRLNVLAWKQGP